MMKRSRTRVDSFDFFDMGHAYIVRFLRPYLNHRVRTPVGRNF